ncbi:hypothetical protein [Arthrobacter sp. Leaf337]|uniref:hypothetical protein n=1 Tax=Arthrobacter sp. Leaf337 TaxID=1736342 RepID=UPI000A6C67FC|nr:hypothetical protein [Arthrobacter sp. Leaf337]
MEVIAKSNCGGKNCPTIYRKDAETIIVQGYIAEGLFGEPLPDGEQAVAIPVSLLAGLKL